MFRIHSFYIPKETIFSMASDLGALDFIHG